MTQAIHVQKLLVQAHAVLARVGPPSDHDELEKRIIRSPAGKRYVVKWLLPLIPPHRCYVEPFAGSAALFFAKETAPEEVLNDRDAEIAFVYRFVQRMTPDTLDELKRLYWKNSRPYFEKLKDKNPANDLERFHKFIYLNRFSKPDSHPGCIETRARRPRGRHIHAFVHRCDDVARPRSGRRAGRRFTSTPRTSNEHARCMPV